MSNLTQTENLLQIYLESYISDGGELTLYLNSNQGTAWKPAQEDFSVSLGKEALQVTGSRSVAEAEIPVTILFLVDVSGSLDSRRMEEMKALISSVTENFREQDRVCIVAMGDELRASGFLTDKEEIQDQIDALTVLKEDTNLYQGIEESLQLLLSASAPKDRKCLVVLSDGAEENSYGITRDEANTAIQDSHIPVYTVGMPKDTENKTELDNVKVLGSFARISAGGIHYVPALDGTDYKETADNIWGNIMAGQVVTADISGLSPAGREVYLQIAVGSEESGIVYAGATVVDSQILTGASETEEAAEQNGGAEENTDLETLQTEGEEGTEAGAQGKSAVPLLAGIAVLAAVLIGILLIILGRKKRKQKAGVSALPADSMSEDSGHTQNPGADIGGAAAAEDGGTEAVGGTAGATETADGIAGSTEAVGGAVGAAGTVGGIAGGTEAAGASGLPVQLIRMGMGESVTYSLTIGKSLVFGRNLQASDFALPEDRGLSGRHCVFRCEEGCLFLEDAGSTNGTYVNGIPVKTPVRLNRDDVLLIGSYEYRIYW